MRRMEERAVFLTAAAVLLTAAWKTPWPEEQTAQASDLSGPECGEETGVPAGETPFYTFRDGAGNLQLELYFDPATGRGWGTRTVYRDGEEPEAVSFPFEAPGGDNAQRPGFADKDAVSAFGGGSGAELVTDYREEWTYDADGKPVQFTSWGEEPGAGRGADAGPTHHRGLLLWRGWAAAAQVVFPQQPDFRDDGGFGRGLV